MLIGLMLRTSQMGCSIPVVPHKIMTVTPGSVGTRDGDGTLCNLTFRRSVPPSLLSGLDVTDPGVYVRMSTSLLLLITMILLVSSNLRSTASME